MRYAGTSAEMSPMSNVMLMKVLLCFVKDTQNINSDTLKKRIKTNITITIKIAIIMILGMGIIKMDYKTIYQDSLKSSWIHYAVFPATMTDEHILDRVEADGWPLESFTESRQWGVVNKLNRKGSRVIWSISGGLNHA